jgi:hypothetical protein
MGAVRREGRDVGDRRGEWKMGEGGDVKGRKGDG